MASKLVPRMIDLASGGTFKEISKSNIATLKIPLPPSYIQEEIVKEIEGYQKIVDGARQVVENYRPSIRIDASWEVAKLGDICELNPKKSEVRDLEDATQVSFVPMADINEHEMLFTPKEVRLISKVYAGYTYFREWESCNCKKFKEWYWIWFE